MKIEYDTAARAKGCADPASLTCGVERGAIVRQSRGEGAIAKESTQRGRVSAPAPEPPGIEMPEAHEHSPVALQISACHIEIRYVSPTRLNTERRVSCQR